MIGRTLVHYRITAAIGAGGMGAVYRATDSRLGRDVAIKVLSDTLAADPQFRERFDREARAVAALNHPNICALYDIGVHDGTSFLVMEYVEGETLAARLERGALPVDQALVLIDVLPNCLASYRAKNRTRRARSVYRSTMQPLFESG